MSAKYRLHCNCQKQGNYPQKGVDRIMMVSVIQKAASKIFSKILNDSPCYGPLKTGDQMLNPANKFVPVGLM